MEPSEIQSISEKARIVMLNFCVMEIAEKRTYLSLGIKK